MLRTILGLILSFSGSISLAQSPHIPAGFYNESASYLNIVASTPESIQFKLHLVFSETGPICHVAGGPQIADGKIVQKETFAEARFNGRNYVYAPKEFPGCEFHITRVGEWVFFGDRNNKCQQQYCGQADLNSVNTGMKFRITGN